MKKTSRIIFKPKGGYVTDPSRSVVISKDPLRYTPICRDVWEVDDIIITYGAGTYEKDIQFLSTRKSEIKSIINDIKEGYLYTDSPKHPKTDTHVLWNKSKKVITWSKSIDGINRLTYAISEPVHLKETLKDGTEEEKVVLYIAILSCKGHKTGKGPDKQYSEKEISRISEDLIGHPF